MVIDMQCTYWCLTATTEWNHDNITIKMLRRIVIGTVNKSIGVISVWSDNESKLPSETMLQQMSTHVMIIEATLTHCDLVTFHGVTDLVNSGSDNGLLADSTRSLPFLNHCFHLHALYESGRNHLSLSHEFCRNNRTIVSLDWIVGHSEIRLKFKKWNIFKANSRHLWLMYQEWWLGAVRQQGITWTSVDEDLRYYMTSLGHYGIM